MQDGKRRVVFYLFIYYYFKKDFRKKIVLAKLLGLTMRRARYYKKIICVLSNKQQHAIKVNIK